MTKKEKKSTEGKVRGEDKDTKRVVKNVEFSFSAPEAMEVYLAGEFNQWDTRSLPMKKYKDGVWKTKIKLLPGRHEYKLLVDRAWVEDIPGGESVDNPFGTQNFIITVK